MSLITAQIDKVAQRLDFDLAAQIRSLQDRTPADVVTPIEKSQRLQFLDRSLGDKQLALDTLERVLAGNGGNAEFGQNSTLRLKAAF